MENEYKIGDRVRIVQDLNPDEPFENFGLEVGDIGTVIKLWNDPYDIVIKFDKLTCAVNEICCQMGEIELISKLVVELL